MKHAARVMIPQGSGVILSTASTAGVTGGLGPHAYTACKTAVVGLTKSVAAELARHGVRVNAIAPGNTVTAMTAVAYTGDAADLGTTTERIKAGSTLRIAGEPIDIANAALYLACEESRYVTGHCLVVDAGQTTNAGSTRFASADPRLILEAGRSA
jgi:NAD(P)-dependent dehydrogenase (short-subunit alcohol dehydrogenase family)